MKAVMGHLGTTMNKLNGRMTRIDTPRLGRYGSSSETRSIFHTQFGHVVLSIGHIIHWSDQGFALNIVSMLHPTAEEFYSGGITGLEADLNTIAARQVSVPRGNTGNGLASKSLLDYAVDMHAFSPDGKLLSASERRAQEAARRRKLGGRELVGKVGTGMGKVGSGMVASRDDTGADASRDDTGADASRDDTGADAPEDGSSAAKVRNVAGAATESPIYFDLRNVDYQQHLAQFMQQLRVGIVLKKFPKHAMAKMKLLFRKEPKRGLEECGLVSGGQWRIIWSDDEGLTVRWRKVSKKGGGKHTGLHSVTEFNQKFNTSSFIYAPPLSGALIHPHSSTPTHSTQPTLTHHPDPHTPSRPSHTIPTRAWLNAPLLARSAAECSPRTRRQHSHQHSHQHSLQHSLQHH
jgi:hypothetical protein